MSKLWGGRFTENTDSLVYDFNASVSFDKKMYRQDITGSIVHARMLGKCGIIPQNDSDVIVKGLEDILSDIESGKIAIDETMEDIHSFVE